MVYPFFMLSTLIQLQAQSENYQSFLSLNFEQTRSLLSTSNNLQFSNIYLDNLNDCAQLVLNESLAQYEAFENRYEDRLSQVRNLPEGPERGFLEAELRLQWAFIASKYDNNWSAFWTLKRALNRAQENIDNYPEYQLNYRTLGLINVVLDMVPENRKWLLGVFGMRGNFELGYEQIKSTLALDSQWTNESKIILALIDSYILEAEVDIEDLPNQSLFAYVKGLAANKQHNAKVAIEHFALLQDEISIKPYLMAESHFLNGDLNEAYRAYTNYLKKDNNNYRKDALLKSGLILWFQSGDMKSALPYFEKANETKETNTEIDRNAAVILKNIDEKDLAVTKLRYYLDGGAMSNAKAIIEQMDSLDLSAYQRFELGYRKARYHQINGDFSEAQTLFLEVIEQGSPYEGSYYVPNALLQLGRLNEKRGDADMAKLFYQRVLEHDEHPYKESLDLKARIAISGLND